MGSKKNVDDSYDEQPYEDRSVFDGDFEHTETDEEDLEVPEELEDSSKDSESGSTDENSWQEETELSSMKCEIGTDNDREPLKTLFKVRYSFSIRGMF